MGIQTLLKLTTLEEVSRSVRFKGKWGVQVGKQGEESVSL